MEFESDYHSISTTQFCLWTIGVVFTISLYDLTLQKHADEAPIRGFVPN